MKKDEKNFDNKKDKDFNNFEQLIIAHNYIKVLRREIGELKSYKDELEYKLEQSLNKLKNHKNQLKEMGILVEMNKENKIKRLKNKL